MLLTMLRWLSRYFSTLLLAFILAVVVWVSAVVTADPNEDRTYTRPLTVVGQDSSLQLVGDIPQQVRITLRAPRSRLNQMTNNPSLISTWLDLSGRVKGEEAVPVKVKWDLSPVRLVQVEPQEVEISLEQIVSEKFTVQVNIEGDPPLGYKRGEPVHEPAEVTVSGPESMMTRVASVHATLNIGGANESVKSTLPLETADENGNPVNGVTITPRTVTVTQPITLQGGYKNVVVKVVTTGQVATGYRLTNISVSPPNVTVFSTNPDLVNELPGYVETLPLDLTGLNDDIDIRMALNLPSDVSLVGEQSVLVQVGVAAIEGSLTVSLPVETLGLPPDLQASISPAGVDVIVSGPLPILDGLTPASFRAVIDVTGLAPGDYQLSPVVDLAPDAVRVQTVLPETVEVVIAPAPTPAPATSTPAVTAQP